MRKVFFIISFLVVCLSSSIVLADNFSISSISKGDFYKFVKVFSEMRGPLRVEILKDKNTNFKDADPLKYVSKVKNEKDVKEALKESGLSWKQFQNLSGNILLAYLSIQPNVTKVALIKQLASYDLLLDMDQIPPEYRQMLKDALKTDEGATLAGMALDFILQIPQENVALASKNKRQLDQLFYTRFWKDKI